MYNKNVPADYQLPIFKNVVDKKFKGDFNKFAEEVYKKSVFASEESFLVALIISAFSANVLPNRLK